MKHLHTYLSEGLLTGDIKAPKITGLASQLKAEKLDAAMVYKNSSKVDSLGKPLNAGDYVWAMNASGSYCFAQIVGFERGRAVIDDGTNNPWAPIGKSKRFQGYDPQGHEMWQDVLTYDQNDHNYIYPATGLLKVPRDFIERLLRANVTEAIARTSKWRDIDWEGTEKEYETQHQVSSDRDYIAKMNKYLVYSRSLKKDSLGKKLEPDDIVLGVTGRRGLSAHRRLYFGLVDLPGSKKEYFNTAFGPTLLNRNHPKWLPDHGILKMPIDLLKELLK